MSAGRSATAVSSVSLARVISFPVAVSGMRSRSCGAGCSARLPRTKAFFFVKQKTAYELASGDWSSDVCSSDLS